jgi:Ni/Fe-hydrogenase 1 B-type cytochrome subunit
MEISSSSTPGSSAFLQKHSAALRTWHWLLFLFLSASIICVIFGKLVFNTGRNIGMVEGVLKDKGAIVTHDQARAVAHEYNDKIWNIHKYIGICIFILLLSRIFVELTQPGDEKLKARMRNAFGIYKMNDLRKNDYQHYLIVKWIYLAFFILLSIMAITGLSLAFDDDVTTLHSIHRPVKEVHEFCQWLMYTYIFVHLAGVIRAEIGKHRGVVSGMIHGKNKD